MRKYEITTDCDGQADTKKYRGCFFFVQNEEIRSAFDTYRKIENLSADGFKSESEQIRNEQTILNVSENMKNTLFKK